MLFRPKFIRQGSKRSSSYINDSKDDVFTNEAFKNTNLASTASFRYGDKPFLVSSQQIRIDWSKFENHTFFNSAVSKVNESFDKIVNFYPFEKSLKEIEVYEDTLTGFEKWVLESFPKNVGYLVFSGTQKGETQNNGTSITVIDRGGANINALSDRLDGVAVLDPNFSPFSLEFFVKVPDIQNDNQILFQKFSSIANNFTIALSESNSTSQCDLIFGITSGSNYLYVTSSIDKGSFTHISCMYDKFGDKRAKILVDNNAVLSSSRQEAFGKLSYNAADFTIGKGSSVRLNNQTNLFVPQQTFSGSLDELKYFHDLNKVEDIKNNRHKSFFNYPEGESLRLYYRFNEPYGNYTGNDIVLDASGNSLHSRISNFNINNRLTGSDNPVTAEELEYNPVLFPTFPGVSTLNESLLVTASLYDDFNPNIITRLVPQHYFYEGTNFKDFNEEFEKIGQAFSSLSDGNVGKKISDIPPPQLLIKLLLTYAKFYDELKLFADSITNFNYTEYEEFDTTPDVFLKEKAKKTNTVLPDLFAYANILQSLKGIDLNSDFTKSQKSLNEIQNLIWRRILSEAPKMKTRKGTIDSIKSVFRNSGIEPDNILNFREYGGSQIKDLNATKEIKRNVYHFLNFSGSNIATTGNNYQGYPTDVGIPRLKSGYLSGSRTQPGVPLVAGTFVNGQSNNSSDGLFTSGSFTYEALYRWDGGFNSVSESLARLHVSGTSLPSSKESCVVNLVGSDEKLSLYIRDGVNQSSTNLLNLENLNVFDSDIWHISFGKRDYHDYTEPASTGSYFLRASKQLNGEIIESYTTSSFFRNESDSVLKNINSYNTSGSFAVIGSQSFQDTSKFINADSVARSFTNFTGMVTNIRFFSKNTSITEFKNRSKNYDSVGVDNPLVNYKFNVADSGSFERLIIETNTKQSTKSSDSSGNIRLFDFSQNQIHLQGENFEANKNLMKNIRVEYEVLSDKFDLNSTNNKIRIRSFQDSDNIDNSYFTTIAPVHEVLYSEESMDDTRFSIDMSLMKGLNENALTIMSDYSVFDDALGSPNNLFETKYLKLDALRDIYFNNVLEKIDMQKYRDIFKWIDSSFTDSIYSLIPRTTNFLGINFIYESHVLERNRYKYLYDEIYLKSLERSNDRGNIFLSQFVGNIKKF